MAEYQTYSAKRSKHRLMVMIRGATLVRFGVYDVRLTALSQGGGTC